MNLLFPLALLALVGCSDGHKDLSRELFLPRVVLWNLNEKHIKAEELHFDQPNRSARLSKQIEFADNQTTEASTDAGTTTVPLLQDLDDETIASLATNTSCGFCEARLNWGDTGEIKSPNYPRPYDANMDCLWLLKTADEDARIQLTCDVIELESCGAQNGLAPTWRDYLIISPLWSFRKSWVYCGHSTKVKSIRHTSICDQMAVTFRSNNNNRRYKGFHCTYKVI